MKKQNITIKDVCYGTLFFEAPHGDLMEVVGIEYNENAGQPIKDQWGGTVWEEPFAVLKAKNTATGKVSGYTVQSQNSDFNGWLTFVKDKDEYKALTKPTKVVCTITIDLDVYGSVTKEAIRGDVKRALDCGNYRMDISRR